MSKTQTVKDKQEVTDLGQLLKKDRLARGAMAWPAYAKFLGVPHITVYKIATGRVVRPHETTEHKIREAIRLNPIDGGAAAAGSTANEVVPAGRADD